MIRSESDVAGYRQANMLYVACREMTLFQKKSDQSSAREVLILHTIAKARRWRNDAADCAQSPFEPLSRFRHFLTGQPADRYKTTIVASNTNPLKRLRTCFRRCVPAIRGAGGVGVD